MGIAAVRPRLTFMHMISNESTAFLSKSSCQPGRRREFCHFDDTPSPCLLKRLLKGEGGAAE